jgi:hypothetical protein
MQTQLFNVRVCNGHATNCVVRLLFAAAAAAAAAAAGKPLMENPAKHLVYRPTAMQLLSILTTTMEVMPKVRQDTLHAHTYIR